MLDSLVHVPGWAWDGLGSAPEHCCQNYCGGGDGDHDRRPGGGDGHLDRGRGCADGSCFGHLDHGCPQVMPWRWVHLPFRQLGEGATRSCPTELS